MFTSIDVLNNYIMRVDIIHGQLSRVRWRTEDVTDRNYYQISIERLAEKVLPNHSVS